LSTGRTRRGRARAWLDAFIANFAEAEDINSCVLWPFSVNGGKGGQYPQIKVEGRTVRVTRYIYERITGHRLVASELVRHTCDTPRCVNPWHFVAGDHIDNMKDMTTRLRQAVGERNGRAQLTEADVHTIRALGHDHNLRGAVSFVARAYSVSPDTVRLILADATWRSV
jgi:hypothetical protein